MALFIATLFVFGLIVGSFLNVVILRFGFVEQARPRSGCPHCEGRLRWFELVPVVSWLVLRGRCRRCGTGLSSQYPLVELANGLLYLLAGLFYPPVLSVLGVASFALLLFCSSAFLLLVVYDLRHTLLPTRFLISFAAGVVALRSLEAYTFKSWFIVSDALLGALALAGFIGLVVLATRGRGMGVGDIYVAAVLGFFFGLFRGVEVLLMAFWIGALVGTALIALKKKATMKTEVPFVPFLFAASLIGMYTHFSPLLFVSSLMAL